MIKVKNQQGFAVLESLLILVIIAIIGGIGWYAIHTKHQTDKILSQADKISQSTPSLAPSSNKQPAFEPATVTGNGVTMRISKNGGPVGSVIKVDISGLPSMPFTNNALLDFRATNKADSADADSADSGISIDQNKLSDGGKFSTSFTIPRYVLTSAPGAQNPNVKTATPEGVGYIFLNYTDPTDYQNKQASDKTIQISFTVTN
jgi:hypothetical protein